jgi:hypothetical protein
MHTLSLKTRKKYVTIFWYSNKLNTQILKEIWKSSSGDILNDSFLKMEENIKILNFEFFKY